MGNLYSQQQRWPEAITAYQDALAAVEILYEFSFSLRGKLDVLGESADLFHRTAYAFARCGQLSEAVVILERGRARNLRETLVRDRTDLDQVATINRELHDQFQTAATTLRELEGQERIRTSLEDKTAINVTPAGIRKQTLQVRKKLQTAVRQIRQIQGFENFLALPTIADIKQALEPQQPLIYLTTTEYGSLAFIISHSHNDDPKIDLVEIEEFKDSNLRELLTGEELSWFTVYRQYKQDKNMRQKWFAAIDHVTQKLWSNLMEPIIKSLLTQQLTQAILIPISCHGYANFNDPLNSGLSMAHDEILTLRDFLDLKLKAVRLAVLSACETAIPGLETIDEAISLATGMLQGGVAGVAASLWSVSDISTMMLMAKFYELWRKENLPLQEALRQSQKWVRDTSNGEKTAYFESFLPTFATTRMAKSAADALWERLILENPEDNYFQHPYFWSAFIYNGI
ncbi:MAG TPA: hypothetical protein DCF68_19385 [Cyanothece sp. UBA12306]|nr:hypothetical protein [Cyanothece sp. UBA12306]